MSECYRVYIFSDEEGLIPIRNKYYSTLDKAKAELEKHFKELKEECEADYADDEVEISVKEHYTINDLWNELGDNVPSHMEKSFVYGKSVHGGGCTAYALFAIFSHKIKVK